MLDFKNIYRLNEYAVTLYRIFLAYIFYFVARLLFYLYNQDLFKLGGIGDLLALCFWGLAFDTTAILYVNLLFIALSLLPLWVNTSKTYQKTLLWIYMTTNLIAFATNFVDFIYYNYTFTRSTFASFESLENEKNKEELLLSFITDYWHVFLIFFICAFIWVKLYKGVKVREAVPSKKLPYFLSSVAALLVTAALVVGGIRGDFKHSTRPINMVDASRHVKVPEHANIVLNTPFAFIRTVKSSDFKRMEGVPQAVIDSTFHPIKQYKDSVPNKPNIVLFILESFGREYLGSFNKDMNIDNYVGYTPFIDSLAQHSLIFPNAFANGRKSIHAMSSILAGIPSFKIAYTSSPYANREIKSIISAVNEMGYDTSFFHGAPNGSMGFLGFGNVLGYDHYYGKTEYNNDEDFDGIWGIWDEPFLQYTADVLSEKQEPFFSTIFTVSSHAPYQIPEKYKGKFPEGTLDIHKCVGYTDYALKQFFEKIENEPWYKNTIFVITADHGNQIYYEEYQKIVNRYGVPILIFDPNGKYKGVNRDLAQQIDIYPTLVSLTGYQKPFRSWGRSLISDTIQKPYALSNTSTNFLFMRDSLIVVRNDENTLGLYDIKDKGLINNIAKKNPFKTKKMEEMTKGFIQDYMNRILDGRLDAENSTETE
ncbi:LTA synthase family protein [Zobellia galactanivorans]|uniref:LTA synthase family protein n=1 Tax=Zobellia galactanivorans (strain DSM 12802 / CCUG 47099 / CIP 106680 / NCIMB 13871 / Dsij) TaxID=63186 RepID=UPI001C075A7E|nr:sulfatase-like hydrolase/transferase [Zobellia galactanivorans]MBU3025698.1 sulfatase-like hydrolase/transferase [Zobellia galactanivorans]